MRALVLRGPGGPLELAEVPVPEPGPGEALVRVAGCGLCHTDLHYVDHGVATAHAPPLTLGHEISGVVSGHGPGVEAPPLGAEVLVPALLPCDVCRYCRSGRANLCPQARMPGNHFDGGFAEYLKVPAKDLVRLPSGLDLVSSAVIADALTTPYHAVVDRAGVQPGDKVAVIGCGGVGVNVVQFATALGAEVAALDLSDAKLEACRALGASITLNPGVAKDPAKELRRIWGDGADVTFEVVGRPETIALGFSTLRRGGKLCLVGYSAAPAVLPANRAMFFEYSVLGSLGCPPSEYPKVIELVRQGRVRLDPVISRRLPLADFEAGLAALRTGEGFRTVLVP